MNKLWDKEEAIADKEMNIYKKELKYCPIECLF